MKYRHSSAQSADYLCLALKHMTKQKAGLHPSSYAIWYEYVANLNPALQAAVDDCLGDEGQLDDEATYAKYDRYLARPQQTSATGMPW
jgi:diguanylate cyclase